MSDKDGIGIQAPQLGAESPSGRHRIVGGPSCAEDSTALCPVASHVVTETRLLAEIEKREGRMLSLQKWVLGGLVTVAMGFGGLVWAQVADAGAAPEKHVATVEQRLDKHEAQSSHVHDGQARATLELQIGAARQTVMLENISARLGTYIPPPVDAGTP